MLTFAKLVRQEVTGMFRGHNPEGYLLVADGIRRKTLVHGDRTLMTEFLMEAGKILPLHSHPQEQTGYLVSGRINLFIGGIRYEAYPGDSWMIPGGIGHAAEAVADSVAVEVFSPVREDYLPGE
jgi:quercetin dioxygenase-like cupin family protein